MQPLRAITGERESLFHAALTRTPQEYPPIAATTGELGKRVTNELCAAGEILLPCNLEVSSFAIELVAAAELEPSSSILSLLQRTIESSSRIEKQL